MLFGPVKRNSQLSGNAMNSQLSGNAMNIITSHFHLVPSVGALTPLLPTPSWRIVHAQGQLYPFLNPSHSTACQRPENLTPPPWRNLQTGPVSVPGVLEYIGSYTGLSGLKETSAWWQKTVVMAGLDLEIEVCEGHGKGTDIMEVENVWLSFGSRAGTFRNVLWIRTRLTTIQQERSQ
jgi:hypothetical protein